MTVEAMRQGRRDFERGRRRQAVERVRAFRTWLVSGSRLGEMPPVPRGSDYELAWDEGEPRSVWDHDPGRVA